ncbi:HEAT repeat domain-containing protein [Spirulina sp. CS-785/01]|uniref:HEAT repeat domain-containing protein n=1 Tax=Spirulina sp. CS-785/01 TaxID=3021716 RepID=UPI00232FE9B9|nr:HEAT repeat domain-containing protein [Spirulina sp. CS-785/01]MDB9311575.1 HEAT repeat domain-containing protein [Spirulina sp. CS-785/01]
MDIVIGLIIGVAVSAVVSSGLQRKTREEKELELKEALNQTRQELVQGYQTQLEEALTGLRQEYEEESQQQLERIQRTHESQLSDRQLEKERAIAELKQKYEREIETLKESHQSELQAKLQQVEADYQGQLAQLQTETQFPSPDATPSPSSSLPVPPSPTLSSPSSLHTPFSLSELLDLALSPNPSIRVAVVSQLQQQVTEGGLYADCLQMIPVLGCLSQDEAAEVRKSAIATLGKIDSSQVIPYLEQALRDNDLAVVQVASEAIQAYKFYPTPTPKPLPKNAAPED